MTLQDRELVKRFTDQCGRETRTLFNPTGDFYENGFEWLINPMDYRKQTYLAFMGTEPVGLAYFYIHNDNYVQHKRNVALFGIAVADKWQRRGIGGRFLNYLEAEAKSKGAEWMATGGGTHVDGMLRPLLRKRGYINLGYINPLLVPGVIVKEKKL